MGDDEIKRAKLRRQLHDIAALKFEIETMRRIAAREAAGDDSDIDYGDIPEMTEEQLANADEIGKQVEAGLSFEG